VALASIYTWRTADDLFIDCTGMVIPMLSGGGTPVRMR